MKLAIVHFMPLEYYPPITNLLNFLKTKEGIETNTWSCHNIKDRSIYQKDNISVSRSAFPKVHENVFIRLLKYWNFNVNVLVGLIRYKPNIVLYYESYSAWPVYFYLKYINSKARLFIHNHEYFSTNWYQNGMTMVKWYHNLEIAYLYQRAEWISQTNHFRNEMFLKENPRIPLNKLKVFSNFPPEMWKESKANGTEKERDVIKCVYVGSLSLEATYLEQFCKWIDDQKGKARFEIYSYNILDSAGLFLKSLKSEWITFHPKGVEYDDLPEVMSKYDVGIILYKAKSTNFIFNETNKLFEYLACGLDVWFPNIMLGTLPHVCTVARPRVLALDFENLIQYQLEDLIGSENLAHREISFTCEAEYEKLYKAIMNES